MRPIVLLVMASTALAVAADPGGGRPSATARDDTAWLQKRLDGGGGRLFLPRLAGGRCYATRGLWVSRDDTEIVSNGACVTALGPGEVRLRTVDGDRVAADAVFYVNRSHPLEPAPVHVTIRGVRIVVPAAANVHGIGVFGHHVTIDDVDVTGAPIDAVTIGPRVNGDGYAGPVTLRRSRLRGGRRNVVSATGVIGLRVERCVIAGATDTYPAPGQPGAGVIVEPDSRGAPILDVRIARNTITGNAGPGILLALSTNRGLPVYANRIEIVRNRILGNGRRATPPRHGGIVFNGGQDRGGARVVVADNVIRDNRGAGLQGHEMRFAIDARRNDLGGNERGPSDAVRFAKRG